MTISIPSKTNSAVLAYHHTQDGEAGYILQIASVQAFIKESDADNLARYMLFAPPVPEVDLEDTQPHTPEVSPTEE